MNYPLSLSFDVAVFCLELLIASSSLYAAWVNLVKKTISKIGFDAFILFFYSLFSKRKAMIIRKDPKLIKRMGIITLLIAVGASQETISLFVKDILPYLR